MMELKRKVMKAALNVKERFADKSGQGALDTAVVVLISVVLGSLILAGLYALLDDTVMPTLSSKIQEMFNYTH